VPIRDDLEPLSDLGLLDELLHKGASVAVVADQLRSRADALVMADIVCVGGCGQDR
jgi:hypothetical protein